MKNLNVENCLRDIADKNGGVLLPEDVVEEASDKRHPLHSKFNWDNTDAAHQYRIWQARQLISVSVQVIDQNTDPSRTFVSLSTDRSEKGGYRLMATVMNDDQMREQLLRDALSEMNTFSRKYKKLRELAGVFDAFKKVKAKRKAA